MLNTKTDPFNSGWYAVKINGKILPMMWNKHNKFYAGVDGKTYKPSEVEGWISEDGGEMINPVTDGIKKNAQFILNLELTLRDTGELSAKDKKKRMDVIGDSIKRYLENYAIGYCDGDCSVTKVKAGIMPEMKTLGELEEEGSLN